MVHAACADTEISLPCHSKVYVKSTYATCCRQWFDVKCCR